MDKQTKQIIGLVALVVVAGVVAYFSFFRDKTPSPPPAANNAAPAPATPNNPPTPGGGAAATPGATPAPGGTAAPVVNNEPLPMPEDEPIQTVKYSWKWPKPFGDPRDKLTGAKDPFHVQNIDVVEPKRREYIEGIKRDWVIAGVTITQQWMPVLDDKGQPQKDENGQMKKEKRAVPEVWFKAKRKPYKEGDRLQGTRFVIKTIITTKSETSVQLVGDNGEELKLTLAEPTRYPD